MTIRNMIVWASGLIEFIGDAHEPEGSILVCTAHGAEAIEDLLDVVREQTVLHDFGDRVGLRVPEIDPRRAHIEVGHDDAVDALIIWESYVRDALGESLSIAWARP